MSIASSSSATSRSSISTESNGARARFGVDGATRTAHRQLLAALPAGEAESVELDARLACNRLTTAIDGAGLRLVRVDPNILSVAKRALGRADAWTTSLHRRPRRRRRHAAATRRRRATPDSLRRRSRSGASRAVVLRGPHLPVDRSEAMRPVSSPRRHRAHQSPLHRVPVHVGTMIADGRAAGRLSVQRRCVPQFGDDGERRA